MPEHRLRPATVLAAVVIPVVLILLGAGCFNAAKQSSMVPSQNGAAASQNGKPLSVDEIAANNVQDEAMSDDITVAYVLTGSAKAPADATIDAGVIGCGDHVAFVKEHRAVSTDNVVNDALVTLFGIKDDAPDGLYDALAYSALSVDKIQSTDGFTTEVWLKGKPMSGGACDTPRLKAQVESTIARFKPHFKVFLNGSEKNWRCLGDTTGKCE